MCVPTCIEEDRSNKNIIFDIYTLSRASIIRYLPDLSFPSFFLSVKQGRYLIIIIIIISEYLRIHFTYSFRLFSFERNFPLA